MYNRNTNPIIMTTLNKHEYCTEVGQMSGLGNIQVKRSEIQFYFFALCSPFEEVRITNSPHPKENHANYSTISDLGNSKCTAPLVSHACIHSMASISVGSKMFYSVLSAIMSREKHPSCDMDTRLSNFMG